MKKTQSQYSFGLASNRKMFRKGMTEGIPIAMGYLAVSFSLGIMAKRAGLSPFAAFLASFFNNASAGEYAAFSLIMVEASYVEVAIMTFIANARYLLMSIALSQKIKPEASIGHRFLVAFDITDEIFALSVSAAGLFESKLYLWHHYAGTSGMGIWHHAGLSGRQHPAGEDRQCLKCCPLWYVFSHHHSARKEG